MRYAEEKSSPIAHLVKWKQELARPIARSVYSAAVGLSDDEVQAIVKHTLLRARRDLSS